MEKYNEGKKAMVSKCGFFSFSKMLRIRMYIRRNVKTHTCFFLMIMIRLFRDSHTDAQYTAFQAFYIHKNYRSYQTRSNL